MTSGQRAGYSEAAPLFPAPGLADLDRLLSRTASAGVRVDVRRCGQPRELPASIDLSAYRIVQEALTNVVKHARTSSCQVLIGYGHDELILEVTDNGAGLPAMAGAGASHRGGALSNEGTRFNGTSGGIVNGRSVEDGGGIVNGRSVEDGGGMVNGEPAMIDMSALPSWSASDDICGGGAGGAFGGGNADDAFGAGGAGSAFGGGHGIIGMRERVSLLGGEFSAGPLPGYGFQVSAHIPLPSGSAS
jgi:signal transduction histidine kinase